MYGERLELGFLSNIIIISVWTAHFWIPPAVKFQHDTSTVVRPWNINRQWMSVHVWRQWSGSLERRSQWFCQTGQTNRLLRNVVFILKRFIFHKRASSCSLSPAAASPSRQPSKRLVTLPVRQRAHPPARHLGIKRPPSSSPTGPEPDPD